jgi:hypothetical protein
MIKQKTQLENQNESQKLPSVAAILTLLLSTASSSFAGSAALRDFAQIPPKACGC